MKRRRDSFRRRHHPAKPIPAKSPYPPFGDGRGNVYPFHPALPPPLVAGRRCYWWHPEMAETGYGIRDGALCPVEGAPLAEVLAAFPCWIALSQRTQALITGMWVPPDVLPSPLPDFVLRGAYLSIAAGDAYVLRGRNEAALYEAAIRLCDELGLDAIEVAR